MSKSPKQIFDEASPSVVTVFAPTKSGGLSQGSGVVVGENQVVSNCHVVDEAERIEIEVIVDPNGPRTVLSAELAVATDADLCLLRVEGLSDTPAKPVVMGGAKNLEIGDDVYAIGTPKDWPQTLSRGIVSQIRYVDGPDEPPDIQTDAAISPGSSGGGLFDGEGRLVGITYLSEGGQNLNFALPSELVKKLPKKMAAEMKIRQELQKCFSAPEPDCINAMVGRIIEFHDDPFDRVRILGRCTREQARMGDIVTARKNVIVAREQTESIKEDSLRERAMFEVAWALAYAGDFSAGLKLAGQIKNPVDRAAAFAATAAVQARAGDETRAHQILANAQESLVEAKLANHPFLHLIAWAQAELGDINAALQTAQKIPNSDGIGKFIFAISSIAGAQGRKDAKIGMRVMFDYALRTLDSEERRLRDLGRGERVLALGTLAWEQAEVCDFRGMRKSIDVANEIIDTGGLAQEDYHYKIEALRVIAESLAKAGDIRGALHAAQRIPVLGEDLAIALAYIAIAMVKK